MGYHCRRKGSKGLKKKTRTHFRAKHNIGQCKGNAQSTSFLQRFGAWRAWQQSLTETTEHVVRAKKIIRIKVPIRQEPMGLIPPKPDTKVRFQQLRLSGQYSGQAPSEPYQCGRMQKLPTDLPRASAKEVPRQASQDQAAEREDPRNVLHRNQGVQGTECSM